MELLRIQKMIAQAGIASRRKAELLIQSGQVTVNGQVVTQLGTKVDPSVDHVKVNGKRVGKPSKKVYYLVNKPQGYICTVSDPAGRPTVLGLVPPAKGIFPVGRLDYNSEGLLLLTNDGPLAYHLARAGTHAPKTYEVKVHGVPPPDGLHRLAAGLKLREGILLAPMKVTAIRKGEKSIHSWFRVVLNEGKNREIRKAFEEIGHRVIRLKRTSLSFLTLEGIPSGAYRPLLPEEIEKLTRSASQSRLKGKGSQPAKKGTREQ
jgi:23S rRNA pseudouridine2605 synthase